MSFNSYDYNILPNIKTIRFPASLKAIGTFAFLKTDIESVEFNGNVEIINSDSFHKCSNLKNIIFNGSVKQIEDYVFNGCDIIGELKFPKGLETIGVSAFRYNANITKVVFPDGLETIMAWSFSDCKKITDDIKIPESVKYIFEEIFNGCKNIERIFVKENNNVKYPLWNNKCKAEILYY